MRERHIYGKGYAVQKYPIDMDLQYDLNDICFNKMQAANIAYPDHNNAVLQYFNLILRQIEPRPRIVHKSDEFVCPAGYDKALEKFEQCIRIGSNLLPFLSTKVIEADKKDDLLNSLGILLTEIPKHQEDTDRTFLEKLEPWSPDLPAGCRKQLN